MSLYLPQERLSSQWESRGGDSTSPCSVPSTALGQHNTHKNEEAPLHSPRFDREIRGGSGFTTVDGTQLPRMRTTGTATEKHLPIHPTATSRSIPEQSNKSRLQSWQSPFQLLDWVKGFKPTLPDYSRKIWAPFWYQRGHQDKLFTENFKKTIPHHNQ